MKKTIYFHMGFPKTGTTSLQSFCYKNSELLEQHGFLYPVIENYVDITVIINGRCFRRAILNAADACDMSIKDFVIQHRDLAQQEINKVWQKMKAKIDASKADKILISCEGFVETEFVLWEFIDHSEFDIKVIIYIRNAYDQMISWYKQRAKDNYLGHYKLNLIEYLKAPDHTACYDVIASYADYLGDENIIIKIYEKDQLKNGNTIDDFFATIGFELPKNINPPIYINTSYSHDTTVLCGFTKTLFAAINYDPGYYPIYELSLADVGEQSTANLVPKELIKQICDEHYEKNCQLAKRFLGRDELFSDRYPQAYYEKSPTENSQGVMISYEQLNVLYEAFGRAFEDKNSVLKPLVNFLAFFLPSQEARQKFRAKYTLRRYGFYKKISFKDFSGSC